MNCEITKENILKEIKEYSWLSEIETIEVIVSHSGTHGRVVNGTLVCPLTEKQIPNSIINVKLVWQVSSMSFDAREHFWENIEKPNRINVFRLAYLVNFSKTGLYRDVKDF